MNTKEKEWLIFLKQINNRIDLKKSLREFLYKECDSKVKDVLSYNLIFYYEYCRVNRIVSKLKYMAKYSTQFRVCINARLLNNVMVMKFLDEEYYETIIHFMLNLIKLGEYIYEQCFTTSFLRHIAHDTYYLFYLVLELQNIFDYDDINNVLMNDYENKYDEIKRKIYFQINCREDFCNIIEEIIKEEQQILNCYSNGPDSSGDIFGIIKEKIKEFTIDKVYFSATVPCFLKKTQNTEINIVMYDKNSEVIVDRIIRNTMIESRRIDAGRFNAMNNSKIKIHLSSKDDVIITCNEIELIWKGEYLNFNFIVYLPENYKKSDAVFQATVYINNVIATCLSFCVRCGENNKQEPKKICMDRKDINSAFMSYAGEDRSKVIKIIQGMKKIRPDLDVFFDVESLRSGEDWEKRIMNEIDKKDILFLCWSRFSKNSEYVQLEWKYALETKGEEFVDPIPLEKPEFCELPEKLSSKHFNDKYLYFEA